jgi:RNA polymerase sigma-70 factor (ECF subfamily)
VWIEPYPSGTANVTPEGRYDHDESVELAFIAALQHLPPKQRAVLILRDVLDFSAPETATMLGTTPTSVYSSLQRAHKAVNERLPHPSQQATLRALGDQALAEVVNRYLEAWHRADVDALVRLLTEDAAFSMPPVRSWFRGRQAIREYLVARPLAPSNRWRVTPTRANGQLAFGHYLWDPSDGAYNAHSLSVITLRDTLIADHTAFLFPDSFVSFGLPDRSESPAAG